MGTFTTIKPFIENLHFERQRKITIDDGLDIQTIDHPIKDKDDVFNELNTIVMKH
jgi:hypothetical protein